MSFEELPTTSETSEPEQKTLTPEEEAKNQEGGGEQARATEHTASVLGPENKSFFERMSEEARGIANQVYEGLYKIPGTNKIIGKLEIAYNQFWIDRYQRKAVKFEERVESLNLRISTLDQSRKDIELAIEDLKSQNIPGIASLQIKLQDIDRQKENLQNKKDRIQSRLEREDNIIKLYTNKRDQIADKLISHYEEILEPMEAKLKKLQTSRDEVDLLMTVTKVKHKEELTKLGDIEKKKNQIEEALRRTGTSEKEIRKLGAIKQLEKMLADGREKVRIEEENLARRKAEIDERIAKVDTKANSYRDKREKFVRVKERRPIKIDVTARQRGKVSTAEEEIRAHSRGEVDYATEPSVPGFEFEIKDRRRRTKKEKTLTYLTYWNELIEKNRYEKYYRNAHINVDNFVQITSLEKNYELEYKDFKDILGKYLKLQGLSMERFDINGNVDTFFKGKMIEEGNRIN